MSDNKMPMEGLMDDKNGGDGIGGLDTNRSLSKISQEGDEQSALNSQCPRCKAVLRIETVNCADPIDVIGAGTLTLLLWGLLSLFFWLLGGRFMLSLGVWLAFAIGYGMWKLVGTEQESKHICSSCGFSELKKVGDI